MKRVWKLLRQHVSIGQLAGFVLANLLGTTIVLLSLQFYRDIIPLFTQGDSFLKKEYIIATKRVSTLGTLSGKSNLFRPEEISRLEEQPFCKQVGRFTPARFEVSAGLALKDAGIGLSTEMFFESVPDAFIDVALGQWHFDPATRVIPIILPRNYLNLYNFGFAQSRNLPKLSEGIIGLVQMDIVLRGDGKREQFNGKIVGFSNRLNTILTPQEFMDWANLTFAPNEAATPSRLIVEVNNPADASIASYFAKQGYEAENNQLDAGKTTYFLQLIVGIVLTVGIILCVLSLYILLLSIFLVLQKNSTKLENLLLIGFSPSRVAFPYHALAVGLYVVVLILSLSAVYLLRDYYLKSLATLFPQLDAASFGYSVVTGMLLGAVVSAFNILLIRRKVIAIWKGERIIV